MDARGTDAAARERDAADRCRPTRRCTRAHRPGWWSESRRSAAGALEDRYALAAPSLAPCCLDLSRRALQPKTRSNARGIERFLRLVHAVLIRYRIRMAGLSIRHRINRWGDEWKPKAGARCGSRLG